MLQLLEEVEGVEDRGLDGAAQQRRREVLLRPRCDGALGAGGRATVALDALRRGLGLGDSKDTDKDNYTAEGPQFEETKTHIF